MASFQIHIVKLFQGCTSNSGNTTSFGIIAYKWAWHLCRECYATEVTRLSLRKTSMALRSSRHAYRSLFLWLSSFLTFLWHIVAERQAEREQPALWAGSFDAEDICNPFPCGDRVLNWSHKPKEVAVIDRFTLKYLGMYSLPTNLHPLAVPVNQARLFAHLVLSVQRGQDLPRDPSLLERPCLRESLDPPAVKRTRTLQHSG